MPILNSAAKIVAKPIPKLVTPRIHAMIDYATVGVFLGTAALFWDRNKRATLGCLISGGAELAIMLLTDYPGGIKKFISFHAHREIDYGLAAIIATMPESLNFEDDDETRFFRVQGALITLLGELSQSPAADHKRKTRARAA